mmetsp:Transcript_4603/g.9382  ORF Transcript_4603/g.9382 Transcript_4603/m.9382 type:complete len:388 (-) Transcript_4603:156-1319(-)
MSGQWSVFDSNMEEVPEPTSTTRLRLEHESGLISHLSAMTVQFGDESLYRDKRAALGQDPLRADADPEALFEKVSISKKSIGLLLMDQSVFAGPGNIYRAEVLFKAGVHPNVKGIDLGRERFDRVWYHTVDLLRRGYECGSILTVDSEEAKALGKPKLRRYIYNSAHCPRCGGRVVSWDVATRTCYACPTCQPMDNGTAEPKAQPSKVFVSHCAREPLADRLQQGSSKLLVSELRAELRRLGLDSKGGKAALANRLAAAMSNADDNAEQSTTEAVHADDEKPLTMMVSAEAAAAEKACAGENRAVEHVAELHPSQAAKIARAVTETQGPKRKRGARKGSQVTDDVGSAGGEVQEESVIRSLGARQTKRRRTVQTEGRKPQLKRELEG